MDGFVTEIAQWVTSQQGVLSICGAILLWAVIAFLSFRIGISPVIRGVQRGINDLTALIGEQGFAEGYESFKETLSANLTLNHAWDEFSETLIVDPALQPLAVRNTRAPSDYFYRSSVIGRRVNLRFYSALPNLLTGTGILGTFVGLVAGIYLASKGLSSADTTIVKQALEDLLSGASLAFMTSIVGLLSSILFSWREKHWVHKLDGRIRDWNDALDQRLLRVTGESLATTQLAESRQQTAILTQFTSELAFQIADAFQDRISSSMAPTLERLVTAVEAMQQDQGKRNDDALHGMLEQFSQSLSGSAGQELTSLGETLNALNDKLESQIGALGDRQDQINEASSESVKKLSAVFKWGVDQIKSSVTDAMDEVVTKVGGVVSEIDKTASLTQQITTDLQQLAGSVTETVSDLNDAAATLSAAATPVGGLLEKVQAAAGDMVLASDRQGQTAQQVNAAVQQINQVQEELRASWSSYAERFENVDESLADVFNQMTQGLDAYAAKVTDLVAGLDKHTSSIVRDLAGANSELTGAIEDLSAELGKVRH